MSDSDLDRRLAGLAGLADAAGRAATVPVAREVRRRAHTRTVRRRFATGAVALVALAAGGFGVWQLPPPGPDAGVTPPPSTAATSAAPSSATASATDSGPPTTASSSPSTSQPSTSRAQPECTAPVLSVTLGRTGAGAGHRSVE